MVKIPSDDVIDNRNDTRTHGYCINWWFSKPEMMKMIINWDDGRFNCNGTANDSKKALERGFFSPHGRCPAALFFPFKSYSM